MVVILRRSLVILFDESHVFVEGNAAGMVGINLVEVPFHHLFSNGDVQGLEGVLHQSPELLYVDQIVFISFIPLHWLLGLLSPVPEKVRKLV